MERASASMGSETDSEEAIEETIRCRKIYYDTARDVLGLFRAIAPLVKAQEIQQVCLRIAVHCMDCAPLQHHEGP